MNKVMDVHQHENNQESKQHLEENRFKFSKQCLKVLELLKQGKVLTTGNAPKYGIRSLPRRIKDLRDVNKIENISDRWRLDEGGKKIEKEWFMNFKTDNQRKEHVYKKGQKSAAQYATDLINTTKKKQTPLF